MTTARRWTTYDEEYLLDNYGSMKMTTMCKKLDRTEKAITRKYCRLTGSTSVKNTTSLLDSSYILNLLGIDKSTLGKWCNNYKFPCTRISNKPQADRYFTSEKVFEWILQNKDRVDFAKCTTGVLLDEPSWYINLVNKTFKIGKSGREWSVSEVKTLIELTNAKVSQKIISEQLDRSFASVKGKLRCLRKNGDYDYYKEVLLK